MESGAHREDRLSLTSLGSTPADITEDVRAAVGRLGRLGYAVLRRAIDAELTASLAADIQRLSTAKSGPEDDRNLRAAHRHSQSALQALTSGPVLGMARAICGDDADVRLVKGTVRARGGRELLAHTDTVIWLPSPFAVCGRILSLNLACTSFSEEEGATFFVPNSHRLCREPSQSEAESLSSRVHPDAAPGDLICWLGETWHGRAVRCAQGERVALTMMFAGPEIPQSKNASFERGEWRPRGGVRSY